MLTFFTTPKPFHGQFARIQRNALTSWTRLSSPSDLLVFGGEEGSAAIAAELHASHIPCVERNEFGMPLVSSLFGQAQRIATTPYLCYANADIVFMDDLLEAIRLAAASTDRFLMVGERYDATIAEPIEFTPGWQTRFRRHVIDSGFTLRSGPDYFVFPRTLWTDIPGDLVVGRAGWENWPIYEARLLQAMVIDATQMITAVHQAHDYSHVDGGWDVVYGGVEANRNSAALGGPHHMFTTYDASHVLTDQGLRIRCRSCYPMCVCKPASF